ncbi:Mov34/MPN/PAD-1 family protein [Pontibacter litorisediminis]|uniref:Mov34/MPN/PAD-1 family protein n=1 Tax=Pontibacter litorisediminis TaxID=1846260 RepID=UPI0023EBF29E|nr:Mov34/MPN/PAD-1 family protein [Pontibacter litorisediminis]
MRIVKRYNNLELIIEEELINRLATIGKKHFPNEFGGFLIGRYSESLEALFIEDFILPKKYKGYSSIFERSTDGVVEEFENAFLEKNQYYVGEWHTHPSSSTKYSQTDLMAMIQIAECQTVQIKNPVLLILSVTSQELNDYSFYYYDSKNLILYD